MIIKDFIKIALALALVLMGLHQFSYAASTDTSPAVVKAAR